LVVINWKLTDTQEALRLAPQNGALTAQRKVDPNSERVRLLIALGQELLPALPREDAHFFKARP